MRESKWEALSRSPEFKQMARDLRAVVERQEALRGEERASPQPEGLRGEERASPQPEPPAAPEPVAGSPMRRTLQVTGLVLVVLVVVIVTIIATKELRSEARSCSANGRAIPGG